MTGVQTCALPIFLDYLCITHSTQHIAAENVNSLEKSYLLDHNKPAMLNPKTNSPSYNPLDAWLVNLTVQFKNGHVANALIDPGSELDIMGHETWMKTSKPMDRCTNMLMQEASNHVTNLQGKCFNVDLMSGNFKTTSNFWVGNIPFEILCGHPWQVRNKINIEEQNDGTWLSHM